MVYISTRNILLDTQSQRPKRKLTPKYIGPYRIMGQINSVSFLVDVGKLKIYNGFHVSYLKPATENNENSSLTGNPHHPHPSSSTNNLSTRLNEFLDHTIRRGQVRFLVKWRGWPHDESTWEPEWNLQNAKEAVEHYWKVHRRSTSPGFSPMM